jgi:7,8-dihydropterin-6-yl-methyl-4-(beta-D-ribofuranosyl)aminobenzene 5'-phosphate synthase
MKKYVVFIMLAILVAGGLFWRSSEAQRANRARAGQPTPAVTPEKAAAPRSDHKVKSLEIKVLSTMLADDGIGEWGFAAVVEADGRRILFDTGAREETVLKNAQELGVDLSDIEDVILSHNHADHTNGLLTLRRQFSRTNRKALTRAHVGRGIFWPRPLASGREGNDMIALKPTYQRLGGKFIEHPDAVELYPGIWLSGSVPRIHPEKNWSGENRVATPNGIVEDNIPEDLSLIIDTEEGLVVISGCGHAGIVNTMEQARKAVRETPVYAVIGGFHLFENNDEQVDWVGTKMREFGVKHFLGGHCTGIEAVYRIRQKAGLERKSCVVSAVGSSFSLEKGIDPLVLAQ